MTDSRLFIVGLIALLAGCVSAPPQKPEAVTAGERLLNRGVVAFEADNYADAAADFDRALLHYQGLDDRDGILKARINLAETALAVGNIDAAAGHLKLAERLAKAEGRGDYRRRLRLLEATVAIQREESTQARELLEPLLPAEGERVDDVALSALADRVSLARGGADFNRWLTRFASAVHSADEPPEMVARLERFRAQAAAASGDHSAADSGFGAALTKYKATAARRGIAATLEEWSAALAAAGNFEQSERQLRAALQVRLWLLDRATTASDLRALATLNEKRGKPDRAAAYARWAALVTDKGMLDWNALRRDLIPD